MTIKLLETVRDELLACQAVASTREFCESWLAKDESYLRVLRYHRSQPSADAWTTCASKLRYYIERLEGSEADQHRDWAQKLDRLHGLCEKAIDMQARAKWMSPERMFR